MGKGEKVEEEGDGRIPCSATIEEDTCRQAHATTLCLGTPHITISSFLLLLVYFIFFLSYNSSVLFLWTFFFLISICSYWKNISEEGLVHRYRLEYRIRPIFTLYRPLFFDFLAILCMITYPFSEVLGLLFFLRSFKTVWTTCFIVCFLKNKK